MKRLGSYKNGNYVVTIFDNGTKVRYNKLDNLTPSTVESMDIKITNMCDMGCPFCHEKSVPNGLHAELHSPSFIDKLHPFTELALGGGNPLSHPDLIEFLEKCKRLQLIPSMTVNQVHFMRDYDKVKDLVDRELIYGLGISLTNPEEEGFIEKVKSFPNAVIHVINGIVTEKQLRSLANNNLKILILGYKEFGRGVENFNQHKDCIEENKKFMYDNLKTIVDGGWFKVVSFDNLSIKQLDPKRLMSEDEWDEFYMGDDGGYTIYVDLVNRQFGLNSCAVERFPLMDTVEEMFNFIRERYNK